MERLIKVGEIRAKNAKEIVSSKLGLGFEKLDRDAFDPEKCYDRVAELGVKWIRIQSGWAKTEKERGVYDFSWLDQVVDNLITRGLKPWLCLCYGNGLYSEQAAKVFGAVGVPPIHTSEEKEAWKNYVKELARHYKGRVETFEVWNEPDGIWCWKHGVSATELGSFTNETAIALKEANPNAYVIGGALCLKKLSYLGEAFTAGFGDHIDGISFHEYTHDESEVAQTVSAYRALCRVYGKDLELIQGESGSQSKSGGSGALKTGAWTQRKQAKQLLRHMIADLMADVKFTSYFSCMDMFEALNGKVGDLASYKDFGYFGVLGAEFDEEGRATGDYTPKQSYRALQVLASLFAGKVSLCDVPVRLVLGHGDEQHYPLHSERIYEQDQTAASVTYQGFCKENGSMAYAYWRPTNIMTTDYEATVSVELTCKTGEPRLVDLMDGSIYRIPEDMCEKDAYGTYTIWHLPVKDYPMMIMLGDFEAQAVEER